MVIVTDSVGVMAQLHCTGTETGQVQGTGLGTGLTQ